METYYKKNLAKFFTFDHLPDDLKKMSQPFCELAETMEEILPEGAEKSVMFRKLLEAKDCSVRSYLNS